MGVGSFAGLGELEGVVRGVGEEVGGGDVAREPGYVVQVEGAGGPVEDFDVDLVFAGGRAPVPDPERET